MPLLVLETTPLSKTEVDYPAMRAMHEASSLESEREVRLWREEQKMRKVKEQRMKMATSKFSLCSWQ
jgi:hypothetical protein